MKEGDDKLPSLQDLWTPKHPGEDPPTVRQRLKLALARLHLIHQRAHRDDGTLLKMADAHSDHHGAAAEQLAQEIRQTGVGHDPKLEDAHMAHLRERRDADQTAIHLRERIGDYRPKL
jgi:hypothetical protein